MNNLHRELAPVSDAAWEQIEEEATRTLKRFLAARRVVDATALRERHCRPLGQVMWHIWMVPVMG